MTDNEINRAVAEKVMDEAWRTQPGYSYDHGVSDYCTDPAAWGALLVWLGEQRMMPRLECNYDRTWYATVGNSRDRNPVYVVHRGSPGRALCLAALRAYGVEA